MEYATSGDANAEHPHAVAARSVRGPFSTCCERLDRRGASGAACGCRRLRDVCFLTPQSIEGPFYLDPRLGRAEIAGGRAGAPLRVDLRVIDGATCKPSERARVDIWHADSKGIYSGYEGQG